MSDAAVPVASAPARRAAPRGARIGKIFEGLCFAAATTLLVALGGLLASLVIGGWPAIQKFGPGFLTSTTWNPVTDVYGAAGPIVGTLVTSALALILALPVAGGVALRALKALPVIARGLPLTSLATPGAQPLVVWPTNQPFSARASPQPLNSAGK